MLEFAHIAVGAGEPLGCASCAIRPAATYLPASQLIEEVRKVTSSWTAIPGPNLRLGGPEPFDHPELPALVTACVKSGAQRVALETDGAALSVPANTAGVLASGVRHLRLRLLAADEHLGDRLGGRPGRTRDAIAGATAFLAAAESAGLTVAVTALVPVCAHTLPALPDTVSRAAALHLHAVRLVSAGHLPPSAPSVLAAACDTGMVNGIWVEADVGLPLPATHRLHAVPEGGCRD